MAKALRILISGNGIAGQVAAYWLSRLDVDITIIDKAPSMRVNGQGIDIRTVGVEVVRRMGVEQAIRDACTGESGTQFVSSSGRAFGTFGAQQGLSVTSDIEIQRGDLVRVINSVVPKDITYRYGVSITDLEETADAVTVSYDNGKSEDFDLVIAAEGLGSSTRKILQRQGMVRGNYEGKDEAVRRFGSAVGLFTLARPPADSDYSTVYSISRGRSCFVRPASKTTLGGYLNITDYARRDELHQLSRAPPAEQKRRLRDEFAGAGWKADALLDAMDASTDFYLQEVGQVYLTRWSSTRGRVALVGDAAYCPSPFTGMGTTCAVYGAYLLAVRVAQEVRAARAARAPVRWDAACAAYERELRPLITKIQKLPPGLPWVVNPQSWAGVYVLRAVVTLASLLAPIVNKFSFSLWNSDSDKVQIPDFE